MFLHILSRVAYSHIDIYPHRLENYGTFFFFFVEEQNFLLKQKYSSLSREGTRNWDARMVLFLREVIWFSAK